MPRPCSTSTHALLYLVPNCQFPAHLRDEPLTTSRPSRTAPHKPRPQKILASPALSRSSSPSSDVPDRNLASSILPSALSPPHPQRFCSTLSADPAPSQKRLRPLLRKAPPLPEKAPPHPRVGPASPPRPEKTPRHPSPRSEAEEGRSAGPAPSAQAPPFPRSGPAQPGCPDSGGCGGTRGVMAASERRAFAHKINR